eukprot:27016-Pyramimonas_sp.AAC.1
MLNRAGRVFAEEGPRPEPPSAGRLSQSLLAPEKRPWTCCQVRLEPLAILDRAATGRRAEARVGAIICKSLLGGARSPGGQRGCATRASDPRPDAFLSSPGGPQRGA